MKIFNYLFLLVGIILIFLHGFFPNQFTIDNFTVLIYIIISIPSIAQFMKEVKFLGAKFIFKEEIRKTEKLINVSGTAKLKTEVNASLTVVKSKALDNARKLLESDPVLALAALRIEIEKNLKSSAKKLDFPIRENTSIIKILINLERGKILSHNHVLILRQIIKMCNEAIHGVAISKDEAKEIIFFAEKYIEL